MTLVVWALAWLLGMAAVALWNAPWWMGGAWFAAATPAVLALGGRKAAATVMVAALLAGFAGWRFAGEMGGPPPDLALHTGSNVEIEGVVDAEADPGETWAAFRVRVERIAGPNGWRETNGAARVYLNQYADYRPGTRLRLKGRLETPPAFPDFNYRAYLARQGVVGTMYYPQTEVIAGPGAWSFARRVADLRLALDGGLQRSLPEPEASLGAGIAFGRVANLPDDIYDDFRTTGLAHLVAVSGSNVSLVAGLVFFALVPLAGRRRAIPPAFVVVLLYVVVAGMSASVVRAGIMAFVFLGGAALGRQQSAMAALGAAAIGLTLAEPRAAADVGFQLSVAATAGLIVFAPWIHHGLEVAVRRTGAGPFVPDILLQAGSLSLAATFATLPVTWVNFGRISLVGPVANLVAEPVFALVFVTSGLTAVAGALWWPGGWVLGLGAYYPLAFLTWFARMLAAVPYAAIDVPGANGEVALAAYVTMAALGWPAYRHLVPLMPRERPNRHAGTVRRLSAAAACGGLALAIVPIGLLPLRGPGVMEVTALDVGQGDAILVTTPHGHHYLIDGGPSGIELARQLGAVLPHWERSLDGTILTHPQEDHIAGFPAAFDRFHVDMAFETGVINTIETYGVYLARAPGRQQLHRGDSFTADGVRFEVVWPPAGFYDPGLNDTSLVLRLTYGKTTVLLTGDFEALAQHQLMALDDVSADVLKVPHHGSKTTAADFLAAVHPAVAIIPVGADNRYGHPSPETLAALEPYQVLRTDERGRITVSSDGERLAVHTQR